MTRVGLPLLIALTGLIVLLVGDGQTADGVGIALIGVAGLIVVANILMRLGLSSERDRRMEEQGAPGV